MLATALIGLLLWGVASLLAWVRGSIVVALFESIETRSRIFWAIVAREMITRYGRNNIGFLWVLLEPVLFSTLLCQSLWTVIKAPINPGMSVAGLRA